VDGMTENEADRRWQYRRVRVRVPVTGTWGEKDRMDELDAAGSDGWEAVGIVYTAKMGTDYTVLLKRPC